MITKKAVISALLIIGYFVACELIVRYEDLGVLAFSYVKTKSVTPIYNSDIVYDIDYPNNINCHALIPNQSGYFKGVSVKTNSFGMRDDEYTLEKKMNTFRIIVIGTSTTFGSGVPINQVYHTLFEEMLNADYDGKNYEVFNWGIGFLGVPCQIKKLPFTQYYDADAVIFETNVRPVAQKELSEIIAFQKKANIMILLLSHGNDNFLVEGNRNFLPLVGWNHDSSWFHYDPHYVKEGNRPCRRAGQIAQKRD